MKKLLSILFAVMLAVLPLGAFAEDVPSAVGVWFMHKLVVGDQEFSAADQENDLTFNFYEDGTCKVTTYMNGVDTTVDGTWTQDGVNVTITVEGVPQYATLEGDALVAAALNDDSKMYCYRNLPGTVSGFVATAVKTDATLENFIANWDCTLADAFGLQFNLLDLGQIMRFEISAETVDFISGAVTGTTSTTPYTVAGVQDGVLTIAREGGFTTTLTYLEGDVIMLTTPDTLTYYFTKEVIEAAQ